jgi:hypothetical protein
MLLLVRLSQEGKPKRPFWRYSWFSGKEHDHEEISFGLHSGSNCACRIIGKFVRRRGHGTNAGANAGARKTRDATTGSTAAAAIIG